MSYRCALRKTVGADGIEREEYVIETRPEVLELTPVVVKKPKPALPPPSVPGFATTKQTGFGYHVLTGDVSTE